MACSSDCSQCLGWCLLISASEEGVLIPGLNFSPQPAANHPGMQKCTDLTCRVTSGSGYM